MAEYGVRFVVKLAFGNHSGGGVVRVESEILALSLRERDIFWHEEERERESFSSMTEREIFWCDS